MERSTRRVRRHSPAKAGEAVAAEPDVGSDHVQMAFLIPQKTDRVEEKLDELSRLTSRYSEHIDKLHRENALLREGELQQALLPLLRGLVGVMDTLSTLKLAGDSEHELRALSHAEEHLTSILEDWGVQAEDPAQGTPFDVRRQVVVNTVPGTEPASDRTIASVIRKGYSSNELLLRRAEVSVYRTTGSAKGE